MRLIVFPFPDVDVSIRVNQPAETIGLIIDPITLIQGIVLPYLLPTTISHRILKFTDVPSPIFQFHRPLGDKTAFIVIIELERTEFDCCFLRFRIVEVRRFQVIIIEMSSLYNDCIFGILVGCVAGLARCSHLFKFYITNKS